MNMEQNKPVLGEMKIVEIGGSCVALFKNNRQWTSVTSRHFHETNITQTTLNTKPYVGYTHNALFGMGRNPIDTRFMHPDDQQKIADAKNTMIEIANQKRLGNSQALIDRLGATGFVTPHL